MFLKVVLFLQCEYSCLSVFLLCRHYLYMGYSSIHPTYCRIGGHRHCKSVITLTSVALQKPDLASQ